jgi:hypothetical protein
VKVRKRRRRLGFARASTIIAAAMVFVGWRPPNALVPFKVWNAIPGSVSDSEGRSGQLYRSPRGPIEVVVFNKGREPRVDGFLDRYFLPKPETGSVYLQCTVDMQSLMASDYWSDEVFRGFLLSRNEGNGWEGDGGIATVKPEGHPNTFVLTDYMMRPTPPGYKVKFRIRG